LCSANALLHKSEVQQHIAVLILSPDASAQLVKLSVHEELFIGARTILITPSWMILLFLKS